MLYHILFCMLAHAFYRCNFFAHDKQIKTHARSNAIALDVDLRAINAREANLLKTKRDVADMLTQLEERENDITHAVRAYTRIRVRCHVEALRGSVLTDIDRDVQLTPTEHESRFRADGSPRDLAGDTTML